MKNFEKFSYRYDAGIAQLVERNLAKVEVASSSLVSRSKFSNVALCGMMSNKQYQQ